MAQRLLCALGGLSISVAAIYPVVNKPKSLRPSNETKKKKLKVNEAIKESRKLINRLKNEVGAPGIVVGVSIDGEEVWKEGLGYADLENEVEANEETVMRIASISKSLTAAVVARLWQDGVIDIDKPVQTYVPTFPEKKFGNEKVTITTRHLMCHLSGIRHYSIKRKEDETGSGDGEQDEFYSKERYDSVEKALSIFKDDKLLCAPGSTFLYSTYGWTLVSAVMEGATGETYPQIMRTFLRELGMRRTCLDQHEPIIYGRSKCYSKNKNGRVENSPYVDNSCKWAGGGFLSTVGDLLKFSNALLFAFQRDGDVEIAKDSYKMIQQKSSVIGYQEASNTSGLGRIASGVIYGAKSVWNYGSSWLSKDESDSKAVGENKANESAETDKDSKSVLQKTTSIIGSGVGSVATGVTYGISSVWNYGSSWLSKDESDTKAETDKDKEKSLLSSLSSWFKPKALSETEVIRTAHENVKELSLPETSLTGVFFWNGIVIPYAVAAVRGQLSSRVFSQSVEEELEDQFTPESSSCEINSPFFSKTLDRAPYILPTTVAKLWTISEGTQMLEWSQHVLGGYGLGFDVTSPIDSAGGVLDGGQPYMIGHDGGAVGASSTMVIVPRKCNNGDPPKGIAVVLLCNIESVFLNPIAVDIAKLFSLV